jgi:hypothetical protein
MFAFVHLLAGAAVGKLVGWWPLAVVLGVVSHFILDALPHTDMATWKRERKQKKLTLADLLSLGADLGICLWLMFWLIRMEQFTDSIFLGALAAIAPDIFRGPFFIFPVLRTIPVLWRYHVFHRQIQHTVKPDRWLYGALIELIFVLMALGLLIF